MYSISLTKVKPYRFNKIDLFIRFYFPISNPDYVLCGGSLCSIFDPTRDVNDYDIFIISNSVEELKKKKQILEKMYEGFGFKKIFDCPKGELITYKLGSIKVQIINVGNRVYRTVDQILDSFDFNICRIAFQTGRLIFDKKFLKDCKKKKLSVNRITYPSSSIKRLVKYSNMGYYINDACIDISKHIILNTQMNNVMELETIYVD